MEELKKYVTINNKNLSLEHQELILKKLDKDRNEIEENGKNKDYIQELYNYADNLLKINPEYFTKEEKQILNK
jgi:hypothetical protein